MPTATRFTNFSKKDFNGIWDKEEFLIKAGESVMLQTYLASHFAKHLIDRELTTQGIPTNHKVKRNEMLDLCLGKVKVEATSQVKLETEMLNQKEEKVEEPVSQPVETAPVVTEPVTAVTTPEEVKEIAIEDMSRKQLDEVAKKLNIKDPQKLPNRTKVIEAINALPSEAPTEKVGEEEAGFEGAK